MGSGGQQVVAVSHVPVGGAAAAKAAEKAAAKAKRKAEKAEAAAAAGDKAAAAKAKRSAEKAKAKASAAAAAAEAAGVAVPAAPPAGGAAPAAAEGGGGKRKRKADAGAGGEAAPAEPAAPPSPPAKAARAADGPATAGASEEAPDAYRKRHDIRVADGCAAPFQTFEAAGFPPALQQALAAQGYERPSPIQAQAWPVALAGDDLVAIAKTGSGKTCAFMMPALVRIVEAGPSAPPKRERTPQGYWRSEPVAPKALVIAPTRELAQQIGEEAVKFSGAAGAKVVVLYGGASKTDQIHAMRGGADVVVATPGRLEDFLKPSQGREPLITAKATEYVVLDEADRMLDMGFEPSIKAIMGECPPVGKRQTLMFSATWPVAVQKIARSFTSSSATHVRIGAADSKLVANPNVTQHVEFMREDEKLERLTALMRQECGAGSGAERCIVFAGTKRRCDELNRELTRAGFRTAGAIHGDKDQWERETALRRFKSGERPILVATDVAARGLDIPDVKVVFVYDFPQATEDYVHRIGRTGRAGNTGKSFTFFTRNNKDQAREFRQLLVDSKVESIPAEVEELGAARGGGGGKGGGWRGGGKGGGWRGGGKGKGGGWRGGGKGGGFRR